MRGISLRSWLLAAAGLAIGLVLGIAIAGRFDDPAWFAAAGVWFGGAGTVVAIVWAVNTFYFEQAASRRRDEAALADAWKVALSMASLVSVRVDCGSSYGGDGNWHCKEMFPVVLNATSSHSITKLEVRIDGVDVPPKREDVLKPGESWRPQFDLNPPRAVSDDQAMHRAPTGLEGVVQYTLDGRRWQRTGEMEPILIG